MNFRMDDIFAGLDNDGMKLGDIVPPDENTGEHADVDEHGMTVDAFMDAFEDDSVIRLIERRRAMMLAEYDQTAEMHTISDEYRSRFGVEDWVLNVAAQVASGNTAKFREVLDELCGASSNTASKASGGARGGAPEEAEKKDSLTRDPPSL